MAAPTCRPVGAMRIGLPCMVTYTVSRLEPHSTPKNGILARRMGSHCVFGAHLRYLPARGGTGGICYHSERRRHGSTDMIQAQYTCIGVKRIRVPYTVHRALAGTACGPTMGPTRACRPTARRHIIGSDPPRLPGGRSAPRGLGVVYWRSEHQLGLLHRRHQGSGAPSSCVGCGGFADRREWHRCQSC